MLYQEHNDMDSQLEQQQQKQFKKLLFLIYETNATYYGQINSSYSKEGLGIEQNFDFATYLGFWKNNKAHGLGLLIHPFGSQIYGYFVRNELSGVAILDNHIVLKCGVFQKSQMRGIGFQFRYGPQKWLMNRYLKGIAIQTIQSEVLPLQQGLPKMLNVEHSLLVHLSNYLAHNYFSLSCPLRAESRINNLVFHPRGEKQAYFGFQGNDGPEGCGLIFNFIEKKVLEVGTYSAGLLDGFGMKIIDQQNFSFGNFQKNKKHGYFLDKILGKKLYNEYRRGSQINKNIVCAMKDLKKKQKINNFQKKEFLSAKSNLDNFLGIFQQDLKELQKKEKKLQKDKEKHIIEKGKSNIKEKKGEWGAGQVLLADPNKLQLHEKTSVQVMKEKMAGWRKSRSNTPVAITNFSGFSQSLDVFEDVIALQEKPFRANHPQ